MSAAATMALVDGPPEPTIRPVRWIGDVLFLETGIGDRLVHRHPAIAGAVALEAPRAAVDHRVEIDLQAAMHLAAETHLLIVFGLDDAGACLAQGRDDFLRALLPMEETMPMPVTTTRLMKRSSFLSTPSATAADCRDAFEVATHLSTSSGRAHRLHPELSNRPTPQALWPRSSASSPIPPSS